VRHFKCCLHTRTSFMTLPLSEISLCLSPPFPPFFFCESSLEGYFYAVVVFFYPSFVLPFPPQFLQDWLLSLATPPSSPKTKKDEKTTWKRSPFRDPAPSLVQLGTPCLSLHPNQHILVHPVFFQSFISLCTSFRDYGFDFLAAPCIIPRTKFQIPF